MSLHVISFKIYRNIDHMKDLFPIRYNKKVYNTMSYYTT